MTEAPSFVTIENIFHNPNPEFNYQIKIGEIHTTQNSCTFKLEDKFAVQNSIFYPPAVLEVSKPQPFVEELKSVVDSMISSFIGGELIWKKRDKDLDNMIFNTIKNLKFGTQLSELAITITRLKENHYEITTTGIEYVLAYMESPVERKHTISITGDKEVITKKLNYRRK